MTYRELTRKLIRLGCAFERQAGGSHEIWINPAYDQETTVPRHGNRYLRVITLKDGETIHNAFFDRRFRKEEQT